MKKKQKAHKDIVDGIQEHIERYDESPEEMESDADNWSKKIPAIGANPWTVNGKLPYEDDIKDQITKTNKWNQQ